MMPQLMPFVLDRLRKKLQNNVFTNKLVPAADCTYPNPPHSSFCHGNLVFAPFKSLGKEKGGSSRASRSPVKILINKTLTGDMFRSIIYLRGLKGMN